MSSFKYEPRRGEMSRIETITITNGRTKSEKDTIKFYVKEIGTIKNLIFFIVSYAFKLKYCITGQKAARNGLCPVSVLIEVFL